MKYFYLLLISLTFSHSIICQDYENVAPKINDVEVVCKLKSKYIQNGEIIPEIKEYITKMLGENKNSGLYIAFPLHTVPKEKKDSHGNSLIDLTTIYKTKLSISESETEQFMAKLFSTGYFEYIEKVPEPEILYDPNDPNNDSQYYLDLIHAYEAWEICKGDSNIIIGITDTGIDFNHDDLVDNVYYNYAEIYNDHIDNDFDGYIDNFKGWDLGDGDSNPQWDESVTGLNDPHGIVVCGAASARTDNALGISGTGFRTKLLPVKVSDEYRILTKSYEGIIYAADHGCSVINCSWGGELGNKYGQDIIDYATFNRNALVVAAAGNSHNNHIFFPASYENVLSVAGTNYLDYKWTPSFDGTTGGSNYGIFVDLCAPGANIYSTYINGSYVGGYGTSFASPIVSGCAAIVKALYPSFNAIQIGEVLRTTTDVIDTISFNLPYQGLLGSGRVNLFKALTETLGPSIRFSNIKYYPDNSTEIIPGSIVEITGRFTNYLSPSVNCSATISSTSPYITITQNTKNIGALATLDTINNNSDPFVIEISPTTPYDEQISIKIDYSGTSYQAFEYFSFKVNPSFIVLDTNNYETTITSNGRFGYVSYYPITGSGVYFMEAYNLMTIGGLVVGNSKDSVVDCLSDQSDFYTIIPATRVAVPGFADDEIISSFSDNNASEKMNIGIKQKAYAWDKPDYENFIIVEYCLENKNNYTLDSIYLGIYADFDLKNLLLNTVEYDQANKLTISKSNDGTNLWAGIKLFSNFDDHCYAFDFYDGGLGGIDLTDGFSKSEKYMALSGSRNTAGFDSINDVAGMLSAGPFTLGPRDSTKIYFSLLAGFGSQDFYNSVGSVQSLFDSLFQYTEPVIETSHKTNLFPNPAEDFVYLDVFSEKINTVDLQVINSTGELVVMLQKSLIAGNNRIKIDTGNLSKGVYIIKGANIYQKLIIR